MADIFVDPVIITTPTENTTKEEVVAYLEKLYLWLEEALNSPHSWFYSDKVAAGLLACGRYPTSKSLQHWKQAYSIDVNISLISRWVGQFFNDESNLELSLENLGYLIDLEADSIIIQPDQFTARWPSLIRDEMHSILAKACACKHMGNEFAHRLCIATSALVNVKKEIEVSARILASEPDFEWNTGNKIMQTFPLLFSPEDLPPPTDIINLWDEGEKGLRYAIDRWYKQDWQDSAPKPLKYSFRPCFFESITQNEIDTKELVLKKIVRIAAAVIADNTSVLNVKYNLRPLRESKTADAPQRTRNGDNAKAWRLTIVPDGVGWRMHYWKVSTPEGSAIEFANVLKKHDPEEIC